MLNIASRLVFVLSLLVADAAAASQLKSISLATADRHARLLLDLSAPAESSLSLDPTHRRLVFRLRDTQMAATLKKPPASHPLVEAIQASADAYGMALRINLKKQVSARCFAAHEGQQWVIQLTEEGAAARPTDSPRPETKPSQVGVAGERVAPKTDSNKVTAATRKSRPQERIIVIDAGHGGKDTGAIGPAGTREKDVVLAIARKLEGMIRAEPGMRAVLTRQGDQFVQLAERADISRREHADLFVSLHADAYVNAEAKGSSVFTLSNHGASSVAARWLADRENSADLVGGVQLRDKGKVLASVLLDLSQNAAIEDSDHAAAHILDELGKGHELHHHEVQKAGFVVLKSPDVPSLLVETAFISNPDEEKNLLSTKYQERVARAVFRGIRAYFADRGPHAPTQGTRQEAAASADMLVAQD
jgi:N-acetylmuramoyl-L-alanine amidase